MRGELAEKKKEEARCWAWVSLVLGSLTVLGALSSGAWPVALVGICSVVGCLMVLFGRDGLLQIGTVLLTISAVIELVCGGMFLVVAIYLIATPSTVGGFGILVGIYALIFSIPVFATGTIDAITVSILRKIDYGNFGKEGSQSINATPSVNLPL